MLMRKYIGDLGELTIVPTLRGASEVLGRKAFDLVIADFLFPEGDALGVIEEIRRGATPQALPIVVVSGSMDAALLSRVLKAGANEGFAKPLNVEEFRGVLQRMMTDPYVREQDAHLSSVTCLQWEQGERCYQYCPELDLKLCGPSREAVAAQMADALRQRMREHQALGYTRRERVVTHVVSV